MNVLLVSQYYVGGGLERMVRLLGSTLSQKLNCKVIQFSFDGVIDEALVAAQEKTGVKVFFELKDKGFSLKTAKTIGRLVREHKINVVHTHESAPLMYAAIARFYARKWFRIVHTQHSFIHLETRPHIARYDLFFQRLANAVTAVSSQVKDKYLDLGAKASKVQIVENGVEFPEVTLSAIERYQLREQMSLEANSSYYNHILKQNIGNVWLLNLSRIHPKKGQDHVIRIWCKLPEHIKKKSLLLFVGPETHYGEIQNLKKDISEEDLKRILFLGSTREPLKWMLASDVFISGSEYEGMPLAPIEAAGCGMNVLLSDIAGHQVLKNVASFFPLNDDFSAVSTFVSAVEATILNKEYLGRYENHCPDEVKLKFGLEKMASRYKELY